MSARQPSRAPAVLLACIALLLVAAGWWWVSDGQRGSSDAPATLDAPLRAPARDKSALMDAPGFTAPSPPVVATPIALPAVAESSAAATAPGASQVARGLRGRVVMGAGGVAPGEPVAGATIDGTLKAKGHRRAVQLVSGADGRFEILLQGPELGAGSAEFVLVHPQGLGRALHQVKAAEFALGDLGDIELLPARPVHVIVLGAAHAPVPGALAAADDDSSVRSGPTNELGRAWLPAVPLDTPSISAWAHRHFRATAPLPAAHIALDAEHPLVLVLERCPSLDIEVTDAAGAPVSGLRAVLASKQALFADLDDESLSVGMPGFAPHDMLAEAGATGVAGATWKSGFENGEPVVSGSVGFPLGDDGRASISGLLPGVPFELSVQDETDGLAWGPEPHTLAPGEARVVHVVLPHPPRDLVVRVTDPQGAPLSRAYVDVVREGRDGGSQPATNAKGLATLRRLWDDEVTLEVDCKGYVTRRFQGVVVAGGGEPFEAVLEPGHTVHLFVQDAHGRPVNAQSVQARLGDAIVGWAILAPLEDAKPAAGGAAGAASTAPTASPASPMRSVRSATDTAATQPPEDRSRWLIADVPPGELQLLVNVGGRQFVMLHRSDVPEAVITVPSTGALHVTFPFALEEGDFYQIEVLPLQPGDGQATLSPLIGPAERSAGELLLPTVLPGDYSVRLLRWAKGAKVACSLSESVRVTEGGTARVMLSLL